MHLTRCVIAKTFGACHNLLTYETVPYTPYEIFSALSSLFFREPFLDTFWQHPLSFLRTDGNNFMDEAHLNFWWGIKKINIKSVFTVTQWKNNETIERKKPRKWNVTEDSLIYNISQSQVCAAHRFLVTYRKVSRNFMETPRWCTNDGTQIWRPKINKSLQRHQIFTVAIKMLSFCL